MTTDKRNFRSSYYEKVGCRSVEEKKSLEMLMKDKHWDMNKLKQFCLRFSVPAAYRNLVWKVLLGVLPLYPDTHTFVWEQRTTQYEDLMYAVEILNLLPKEAPRYQVLYTAWQLETGRRVPLSEPESSFSAETCFKAIASSLYELYDDDITVYWLSKAFCTTIKDFQNDMPKLLEIFRTMLEKEDEPLYKHVSEICALEDLPLTCWFNCCFAGVLDNTVLPKIWDKVSCGAWKILSYVAVSVFVCLRRDILHATDTQQLLSCLHQKDSSEEAAAAALQMWHHADTLAK